LKNATQLKKELKKLANLWATLMFCKM
jgi:hypothetical protein